MGKNSSIEWTNHTFNPWWGCSKVSEACKYCYAESWSKRIGKELWGDSTERRFFGDDHWAEPDQWNKEARKQHTKMRVFCASMADVFEARENLDPWRARLWKIIEDTQYLNWLLLSKRPENFATMIPWKYEYPRNIWLGTTVENQQTANKRISALINQPAAIRFISCEPLLGLIDFTPWLINQKRKKNINWVIVGGESGPYARPMNPEWVKNIRNQCVRFGVSFYFKQWGSWRPSNNGSYHSKHQIILKDFQGNDSIRLLKVGKKRAGRDFEGRIWNDIPVMN